MRFVTFCLIEKKKKKKKKKMMMMMMMILATNVSTHKEERLGL